MAGISRATVINSETGLIEEISRTLVVMSDGQRLGIKIFMLHCCHYHLDKQKCSNNREFESYCDMGDVKSSLREISPSRLSLVVTLT